MFGEVFLVTLFWSLWIPWRAPSRSFGATVINTVDQLINNRKLFLTVLEPGKSQDHQQVPRLVRPVSWFLDCLLLLPVLAAWEPIPSWPEPSQSPCLLVSSPRAGWRLRAHKPNSPLQSVSIPCIISVLWNNLSFPKDSIYIHFVICSLGSWK